MAAKLSHPLYPLIRKLESVTRLSDGERRAIEALPVRVRTLSAKQDIVRDGDQGTQCCVIVEGWACRYKFLSEGRRQIFSFHIAGDIPDLQSLHLPLMDHTLGTMTQATVAFIPHENLHDLTARFPSIAAAFWRETLIDAAIFREWLVAMGRRPAFEHLAHLFCELYLKQEAVGLAGEHRCPLPITQVDLADATGMTPVHINRVLKEMRGRGLITLDRQTLVVKAWEELVRVSEFDATYLQFRKRSAG